jgi:uncharacterized protein YccT (UPF0319 family)
MLDASCGSSESKASSVKLFQNIDILSVEGSEVDGSARNSDSLVAVTNMKHSSLQVRLFSSRQ